MNSFASQSIDPLPARRHDMLGMEAQAAAHIKRQLGDCVAHAMDGWNQSIGAARIGIRQGELSELMRADLKRFSIARLINILARLDRDIELHVRHTGRPRLPTRPTPTAHVVVWDRFGNAIDVPRASRASRTPIPFD